MTRTKLGFLLAALLALPATAGAVHLNGKKGIGYTQAIGGPGGLSFNYAVSALIIEGVFGLRYTSFPEDKATGKTPDADIGFHMGLGTHIQALQAQRAALTIGGRMTLGTGVSRQTAGTADPKEVTQLGVDIPMRVYWFPDDDFNISIHAEMGVSLLFAPEDGTLFGDDNLKGDGFQLNAFDGNGQDGSGLFGALGLTFWW